MPAFSGNDLQWREAAKSIFSFPGILQAVEPTTNPADVGGLIREHLFASVLLHSALALATPELTS